MKNLLNGLHNKADTRKVPEIQDIGCVICVTGQFRGIERDKKKERERENGSYLGKYDTNFLP